MKLINNPDRSQWAEILKRPVMNTENLFDTVRGIIDRVKSDGDRAVLEMEAKFDKAELTSLAAVLTTFLSCILSSSHLSPSPGGAVPLLPLCLF